MWVCGLEFIFCGVGWLGVFVLKGLCYWVGRVREKERAREREKRVREREKREKQPETER
jgi:hypothetical protein